MYVYTTIHVYIYIYIHIHQYRICVYVRHLSAATPDTARLLDLDVIIDAMI